MMKIKRKNQGFTLTELAVVIAVIAALVFTGIPYFRCKPKSMKIITNVNKIKQITTALNSYAIDWDGEYPSYDRERGKAYKFTASTEAFNALIPEYIDTEQIFWISTKNPDKLRPPIEDWELTRNENCYVYVTGQKNTGFAGSPLVADGEMVEPGAYGEYHPWLKSKTAVVGYVDGHVSKERLTSDQPGATVQTRDGWKKDIFQKRIDNDNGGNLDTERSNILLP